MSLLQFFSLKRARGEGAIEEGRILISSYMLFYHFMGVKE